MAKQRIYIPITGSVAATQQNFLYFPSHLWITTLGPNNAPTVTLEATGFSSNGATATLTLYDSGGTSLATLSWTEASATRKTTTFTATQLDNEVGYVIGTSNLGVGQSTTLSASIRLSVVIDAPTDVPLNYLFESIQLGGYASAKTNTVVEDLQTPATEFTYDASKYPSNVNWYVRTAHAGSGTMYGRTVELWEYNGSTWALHTTLASGVMGTSISYTSNNVALVDGRRYKIRAYISNNMENYSVYGASFYGVRAATQTVNSCGFTLVNISVNDFDTDKVVYSATGGADNQEVGMMTWSGSTVTRSGQSNVGPAGACLSTMSTSRVVAWNNAGATTLRFLSWSGSAFSKEGSDAAATNNVQSVAGLSSTVLATLELSGTTYYTRVYEWNGTTLTQKASYTIGTVTTISHLSICRYSATQYMIAYNSRINLFTYNGSNAITLTLSDAVPNTNESASQKFQIRAYKNRFILWSMTGTGECRQFDYDSVAGKFRFQNGFWSPGYTSQNSPYFATFRDNVFVMAKGDASNEPARIAYTPITKCRVRIPLVIGQAVGGGGVVVNGSIFAWDPAEYDDGGGTTTWYLEFISSSSATGYLASDPTGTPSTLSGSSFSSVTGISRIGPITMPTGSASIGLFNSAATIYAVNLVGEYNWAEVSTGYTLALDSQTYSLTGIAAGTKAACKLVCAVGAFTLTGRDATLTKTIPVVMGLGTFTLSGIAAGTKAARRLVMGTGAVALNGIAANVKYGRRVVADSRSYAHTGIAAGVLYGREVLGVSQPYTLTGIAAGTKATFKLVCAVGAFTHTGQAATFSKGRRMTMDVAAFTLTGIAANVKYGRRVAADVSAFTLSGIAAGVKYGRKVAMDFAAFALSGQAANLPKGKRMIADAGSFTHSGQAASIRKDNKLPLAVSAFTLAGIAVSVERGYRVAADVAAVTLTGQNTGLLRGRKVVLSVGAFTHTGIAAGVKRGYAVLGGTGAIALNGQALNFKRGIKLAMDTGAFTLTGYPMAMSTVGNMQMVPGTFTMTGGVLKFSRTIKHSAGSFSFTGYTMRVNSGMPMLVGSFVATGYPAAIRVYRRFTASHGEIALTYIPAGFRVALRLAGGISAYILTGNDAGVNYITEQLNAQPGVFSFTGFDILFERTRAIKPPPGIFTVTGNPAVLAPAKLFMETLEAPYLNAVVVAAPTLFTNEYTNMIYYTETNIIVQLTVTDTLAGATNIMLNVVKPNNEVVQWTPDSVVGNVVTYKTATTDVDLEGDYRIQVSYTSGSDERVSSVTRMIVKNRI